MPNYAALLYPSANRVYTESAARLLRAELAVFAQTLLDTEVATIDEREIGGVPYITFDTDRPLSDQDIGHLSDLSALYALFEVDGRTLLPCEIRPLATVDSDLLTIQKYAGKTNELFTKLLLNVTAAASKFGKEMRTTPLRVLDPLCGRGTTLNQAMRYGYHTVGFEIDERDFEAYLQFIKTWLRDKRFKHQADTGLLRRNKVRLGRRLDVEFATSKEKYKSGDTRTITYLNCDTLTADALLKANSIDLIVTDAPYGVQHGSHRDEQTRTRDPRELLTAAVPGWRRLLRTGGALGISWNTAVLPRAELVEILAANDLEVRDEAPFTDFTHRVDRAILRDLVVATKPATA